MRIEQISIVFTFLNNNYNYHVGMENMKQLAGSCYKAVTRDVTKLLQELVTVIEH